MSLDDNGSDEFIDTDDDESLNSNDDDSLYTRWYDKGYDHSIDRWRKKKKRKTEDNSTVESVLDLPTSKVISKFISQGYIKGLKGVISTGKEANVYHAYSGPEIPKDIPEIAVKVYRTRTLDFKKIKNYIAGDIRFQKSGRKSHQIIEVWALKEFKNLSRAYENGIYVPRPIKVKRNVLLMEFLGEKGMASSILSKFGTNPPLNPQKLYDDFMSSNGIIGIWKNAHLVHGDLSPYNIVFHKEKPIIIDWGQGVVQEHHLAEPLLYRDIKNMVIYFESLHDVDCQSIDELYEQITGTKPSPAFESLSFI